MEHSTEQAIFRIYQAKSPQEMEDAIDPDDPFFAAIRVPGADVDRSTKEQE